MVSERALGICRTTKGELLQLSQSVSLSVCLIFIVFICVDVCFAYRHLCVPFACNSQHGQRGEGASDLPRDGNSLWLWTLGI